MPPWRPGWTRRRAAGRRKSFSGIKLDPVSRLEEQAAPGRDWARRSGEARGRKKPAAGEGGRPPRPGLPAPPLGRSTPGAGPGHSKRLEAPRTLPRPRRRSTAPHRCTLGPVVLKRANTRAWNHGETTAPSMPSEGPAPPRDEDWLPEQSPVLPEPPALAGGRVRDSRTQGQDSPCNCNSASPRDAGGATCHGRSWTSRRPAGAGAPLAAGAAWPCSPRADPPGSARPAPSSPRGRARCRQGARAEAARIGAGLALGAGLGLRNLSRSSLTDTGKVHCPE